MTNWCGRPGKENERLPTELGWTKKEVEVNLNNILDVANVLRNATSLFTGAGTPHKVRRDLHASF